MNRFILIILLILFKINNIYCQHDFFIPNKKYMYKISYINDSFKIYTSEVIAISSTGNPWKKDSIKQKEIIITYNYSKSDSLLCKNLPSMGWVKNDTTGLIDIKEKFWFHPPRSNQYKILETAPYPRIEFPLLNHKTFSTFLFVGEGWGEISNTKFIHKYLIVEDSLKYWHVEAISYNEMQPDKINKLYLYFNEKKGISKLNYVFHDKIKIEMILIE